jgi:hypothetical protein
VLKKSPGIINLMKTNDDRKSWLGIPLSASKTGEKIFEPSVSGEYRWQKVTLPLDGGYGARSGFEEV